MSAIELTPEIIDTKAREGAAKAIAAAAQVQDHARVLSIAIRRSDISPARLQALLDDIAAEAERLEAAATEAASAIYNMRRRLYGDPTLKVRAS